MLRTAVLTFCIIALTYGLEENNVQPHIIFIVADDLGWNDVGFHGTGQVPTPNIDALAYSGIILNNYYVSPLCTPSRSALMTGKHPIHTGMQHLVLLAAERRGLPLTEKLLPQYLEELGYVNHIVGKWHLGFYKKEYTPIYRGFKSHLGYWTAHQDYFDHTAVERALWGLDMRRNMDIAYDLHGQYSTDIFTNESVNIIQNHNTSSPLFLYLAHVAVHSGNPYEALRAPDSEIQKFSYIEDYNRQRFAAMLSKLDDSVGKVVQALKNKNMLENSILVFTTDNGGPAAGFDLNAASNYPLRGIKQTIWEGGVRGAALIWSPLIQKSMRVANQTMHISDWLPTLVDAAGGNASAIKGIDGINLWTALSENKNSDRTEILHNIDDIDGNWALTVGAWKILKGTVQNGNWDSWYGPSGRDYIYNLTAVQNSPAGLALQSLGKIASPEQMGILRAQANFKCPTLPSSVECKPLEETCLFNIIQDPCETNNVAQEFPEILSDLENILREYNKTAIPAANLPWAEDGNPKYSNYVYSTFGDINVKEFNLQ